jgi:hypothetical protein
VSFVATTGSVAKQVDFNSVVNTHTSSSSSVVFAPAPQGKSAPLIEEDYFADATRVKSRYEAQLGRPIRTKELVIYQYYALLEAQDPKNPEHVNRYKLWANKVERPEPVRLGTEKKQLQNILFSLDEVDFTLLSKLIKQTLEELKIEEGKVTHVFLERDGTSAKREPIWRVYVNGTRDSGFIEYSLGGQKRRVVN